MSERYYSDISEVTEASDANSVNSYLKMGYELLKIVEKTLFRPDGAKETSIVYVLGRRGTVEAKPEVDASLLEKLPFKPYKEGSASGWLWADPEKYEGEQKEAIKWLREKIEREKKVTVGKFTYTFSGPEDNPTMFISRRPAEVK
jgi:hypothetical protein